MFLSKLSIRGYIGSVLRDARDALVRVWHDRASIAAIILFVLPWASMPLLRSDWSWLTGFGEIVAVALLFWWMSRSGAAPGPQVKRPLAESLMAIGLVVIWVEWRGGICAKTFPFLPDNFNCFENLPYETIPKLVVSVVFPLLVLRLAGYGFRTQGVGWSWRSWWVALPVLIATLGYGLYTHPGKPLDFLQNAGKFFFAAGLPEEVLFRAVLLTRLEAWWRSPGWALFGAAAIFGLSHIAIDYLVFTKQDWRETWITLLTFQMGFGFAFAFGYQRIRNIWPLAIIHAMVDAL